MKWLIASDIHGSAFWCRRLLEEFEREKADRLILLGDLLYHGPRNTPPTEYEPMAVAAMLNKYSEKILAVRGNCDAEIDQMVLDFPIMADYTILDTGDRLVFITHGHIWNNGHLPPLAKGSVLLHGHTHVVHNEDRGDHFYVNPGSVSIPKKDSPRGYAILENGVFTTKEL